MNEDSLCASLHFSPEDDYIGHLVETSASFTEQLSCPQRIFVCFVKFNDQILQQME